MSISPSVSRPDSRWFPTERTFRAAMWVLGLTFLATAAFQTIDPVAFVKDIGPFGVANGHYVRDLATWSAAFGIVFILAASRRSWRVPLLTLAIVQGVLHLINHIVDVGDADPVGVGIANIVALAAMLGLFAWLLAAARQAEATR